MIRFLLRFLGLLCLALGFILLVYDGAKSIVDQRWHVTKVSDVLNVFSESSLTKLQLMFEGIAAWLWDPVLLNVLNAPSWFLLFLVGTILILLGRKRRPLIGYAR